MTKIKHINSIQNLGVYKNYMRTGDIRDFNDKNIIYGWNYCGKTTLSRLLNWLNANCGIDEDYIGTTFEIELEDGTKITQANKVISSPCVVQVFNSDFILNNLQFASDDNKIKAIAFDLGEEIKPIRDKIVLLNNRIDNYNFIIKATTSYTARYNNLENLFTNRARTIKNDFFNSTIEFTKAHLRRIIDNMSFDTYRDYIIADSLELSECQSNALEKDAKPTIDQTRPILLFDTLLREVKRVLALAPHETIRDEVLSNNQNMYAWAKTGLDLHTHPKILATCAFCGQPLSSRRVKYLNEFYSNEAARVKEAAKALIQQIEEEKRLTQLSAWLALNEFSFTGNLGNQYKTLKGEFDILATKYVSKLDEFIRMIEEKIDKNLFVAITLPKIDTTDKDQLEGWISQLEAIIKSHNESVNNFSQTKSKAIDKYKKHLVATFWDEIDYYTIQQGYQKECQFHTLLTTIIKSISQQILELETQVKSIAKGKEVCNQYIKLLLHREDIKIETTEDGYFTLKRANKKAKNLSEGEKSAIAFAYFLVLLESDIEKLKKSIIVIDDPISSLDANHIAQIASLITTFFFRKGLDESQKDKICNCFQQLFILTHNFDFYSIIHDANILKKKKKQITPDGKSTDVPTLHEYLIKKINKEESVIVNMPKSLSAYKSEYVYLWKQIIDYKNSNYSEDMLYMMPNVARRFLEIYTLIKLPGSHDEIDNRIKILVDDVNELRILHNFSHFTSLERVANHSELILRMPDIIEDIYTLIQKDEVHFNSLNDGIKNG